MKTKRFSLAKQLFYLPFVKTVYISGNFIAIEKFSIVEWEEVQEEVANQIEEYITSGGIIINEETLAKKIQSLFMLNQHQIQQLLNFVANKMLTKLLNAKILTKQKPSVSKKDLFSFLVKEVFIDENYVSITKYDIASWDEITFELRNFLKQYLEQNRYSCR